MNDGRHTINGLLSTAETPPVIVDDAMICGAADTFESASLFGTSVITNFSSAPGETVTLPTSG